MRVKANTRDEPCRMQRPEDCVNPSPGACSHCLILCVLAAAAQVVLSPIAAAAVATGHAMETEVHMNAAEPAMSRLGWMVSGAVIGAAAFHLVSYVLEAFKNQLRREAPVCYVMRDGQRIDDADVVSNGDSRTVLDIDDAWRFDVLPKWKPGHRVKIWSARGANRRRTLLAEALLQRHADTGEFYLDFDAGKMASQK